MRFPVHGLGSLGEFPGDDPGTWECAYFLVMFGVLAGFGELPKKTIRCVEKKKTFVSTYFPTIFLMSCLPRFWERCCQKKSSSHKKPYPLFVEDFAPGATVAVSGLPFEVSHLPGSRFLNNIRNQVEPKLQHKSFGLKLQCACF